MSCPMTCAWREKVTVPFSRAHEQVRPCVGGLDLVLDDVSQRQLDATPIGPRVSGGLRQVAIAKRPRRPEDGRKTSSPSPWPRSRSSARQHRDASNAVRRSARQQRPAKNAHGRTLLPVMRQSP